MATFRKREECPASQELLAYQLGSLESDDGRKISRHLSVCEFCSAEVDFYEHYPQSDEAEDASESANMPAPLYELAEAILNKKSGSKTIAKIMGDIEKPSGRHR